MWVLLTCIARLFQKVPLRLHNLKIWEKFIVRPKSKLKANSHYNMFEMGILPTQQMSVLKGQVFVICTVRTTKNDRSKYERLKI
jgi:hypothetical protein